MGRREAQLFPNAQRAQHYGTPPPAEPGLRPVSPAGPAKAEAAHTRRTVLPPLPEPPTELIMPDGRVVPLVIQASFAAPGPAHPTVDTADPRAPAGSLPTGLAAPRRGWRGRLRKEQVR